MNLIRTALWIPASLLVAAAALAGCKGPPPTNPGVIAREPNVLLWGDTHVHSSASADARESVDTNTAYDWARGIPVVHPLTRARIQLERPLDFIVVTDHAEGLKDVAWSGIVEAAERHYAPCAFTTFIAWEWSSELGGKNLHRVVLMNEGGEKASQLVPFSSLEGPRPEALWSWLEETSSRVGTDFIAIPHGPGGGGTMYPEVDSDGEPISSTYAEARMRWEPIAEVTQVEGDFETTPALSPDDEFADFERAKDGTGDYARAALLRGLQQAQSLGANPFQFGMIGSTNAHTGLASANEEFFYGVIGPGSGDASAQGLTAVWAEENTRTSIFDALRRREVYATTGPRIRLRFFGGWGFSEKQAAKATMVLDGYTLGHPMGSELSKAPDDKAPSFLMYAVKDPEGAKLDRIQLIKGWVDAEGKPHERIYDVVWSPGRARGPDGKVPPVGNTVDLATAEYENTVGASALHGFWSDPDFDPQQHAFYYVRVLQMPTPRHTLYDAVARGTDPAETGHPSTIQERAYSSPIWYAPSDD